MSWFQDLAGKAENILTKIDQNAATVLQTRPAAGDVEGAPLLEVSVMTNKVPSHATAPKPRVSAKGPLLTKKSPRGMVRSASSASNEKYLEAEAETHSSKSEKLNMFETSSRRSSLNSKQDGTVIDMNEVVAEKSSYTELEANHDIEKELAATKIVLAEIKAERDELKTELDNTLSQQLTNGETESKLLEFELLCQSLSEEKMMLAGKVLSIEEANSKYVKSISELESTIAKHIQSEQELNSKLEMARLETQNALTELQQYRVRAHATLQLKEKTIEQLKEQMNGGKNDGSPDTNDAKLNQAEQILQIELEQIRQEKANLLEELTTLNERMKQREGHWWSAEEKLKVTVQELEQNVQQLQQQILLESDKYSLLEENFKLKQNELATAQEDLIKQRTSFTLRLREKESENNKLRNRIQNRPVSPLSDHGERLASLTQSLVQKQTALETVTAERNALRIQLEKLENQYRNTASQVRQQRAVYLNSNVTDDAKSQVPNFMLETPFDNNVARRMKRAYSSLDSIGIRLGVFLRRYPLIRILVIVYVAVLHLWVMFVLLSSSPN